MKKIYKTFTVIACLFLSAAAFILAACTAPAADFSDDIKHVAAQYFVSDELNEPKDAVSRTAALKYTRLYVTPKHSITIKGISFKAQLAGEDAKPIKFTVKAGISNPERETVAASIEMQNPYPLLLDASVITIGAEESEVRVTFAEYTFDLSDFDNVGNTYSLWVEFIIDGNINRDVAFIINHFAFIV